MANNRWNGYLRIRVFVRKGANKITARGESRRKYKRHRLKKCVPEGSFMYSGIHKKPNKTTALVREYHIMM
jgi:hypothetical protein